MSSFRARFDAFWFTPAPVFDLAICRLAVVGFVLVMMLFPQLVLTIPPWSRHAEFAVLPDAMFEPIWLLRLLTLPFGFDYRPTASHLEWAHLLAIASAAFAFVGLFTRASLAVLFVTFAFVVGHSHSFGEFHHIETMPAILLLLLAASPSGRVLSIDNLRRRDAKVPIDAVDPGAGWPLRVMVCVFAMAYLSAALSKLLGGGIDWLNGTTLQRYLVVNALYWDLPLGLWFAEQFTLVKLLSWFTIAFEATFLVVIWRPKLGWIYAVIGTGFHLGIWWTMKAPFIAYVPCYAVLVPWSRLLVRQRA